jgi:hypothetical protein
MSPQAKRLALIVLVGGMISALIAPVVQYVSLGTSEGLEGLMHGRVLLFAAEFFHAMVALGGFALAVAVLATKTAARP